MCRPSQKVKTPKKNTDWKDKFFYFCLPPSIDIQTKWNLSLLQDKLGSFKANPTGFKKLERTGAICNLSGNFEEVTLVRACLGQTSSNDDISNDGISNGSKETRAPCSIVLSLAD